MKKKVARKKTSLLDDPARAFHFRLTHLIAGTGAWAHSIAFRKASEHGPQKGARAGFQQHCEPEITVAFPVLTLTWTIKFSGVKNNINARHLRLPALVNLDKIPGLDVDNASFSLISQGRFIESLDWRVFPILRKFYGLTDPTEIPFYATSREAIWGSQYIVWRLIMKCAIQKGFEPKGREFCLSVQMDTGHDWVGQLDTPVLIVRRREVQATDDPQMLQCNADKPVLGFFFDQGMAAFEKITLQPDTNWESIREWSKSDLEGAEILSLHPNIEEAKNPIFPLVPRLANALEFASLPKPTLTLTRRGGPGPVTVYSLEANLLRHNAEPSHSICEGLVFW